MFGRGREMQARQPPTTSARVAHITVYYKNINSYCLDRFRKSCGSALTFRSVDILSLIEEIFVKSHVILVNYT